MKYFYQELNTEPPVHGKTYYCDHPVYNKCTLYSQNESGLAVIQQRYNPKFKTTFWTEIDRALVDDLYSQEEFQKYFEEHAKPCTDGLYPTVTVRQIMWALRMKPLKREPWETVFDKKCF